MDRGRDRPQQLGQCDRETLTALLGRGGRSITGAVERWRKGRAAHGARAVRRSMMLVEAAGQRVAQEQEPHDRPEPSSNGARESERYLHVVIPGDRAANCVPRSIAGPGSEVKLVR